MSDTQNVPLVCSGRQPHFVFFLLGFFVLCWSWWWWCFFFLFLYLFILFIYLFFFGGRGRCVFPPFFTPFPLCEHRRWPDDKAHDLHMAVCNSCLFFVHFGMPLWCVTWSIEAGPPQCFHVLPRDKLGSEHTDLWKLSGVREFSSINVK